MASTSVAGSGVEVAVVNVTDMEAPLPMLFLANTVAVYCVLGVRVVTVKDRVMSSFSYIVAPLELLPTLIEN